MHLLRKQSPHVSNEGGLFPKGSSTQKYRDSETHGVNNEAITMKEGL